VGHGGLSLALVLGGVNAACTNFRPPPRPPAPEVSATAPSEVWSATAGRRFTGPIAIRDTILYGAGVDRKVYAVSLSNGRRLWSSRLGGLVAGGLILSGDTLYVGTSRPDGRVYALDRHSGKQLWRVATGPVGAPLSLASGVLVAESQSGEVYGIDPASGAVRWHPRLGVARVAAEPVDSGFVIATVDSLFRIGARDGAVSARARTPGTILSPWLLHDGLLVAGTADSLIVGVRPTDLSLAWQARVDAPVLGSPAAIGDTLYAVSRRGTLFRIDPGCETSAVAVAEFDWAVSAPVTTMGDTILLGGADGSIRAFRPDGVEVWRLQVWHPVELPPVLLPDGLLAIGGNGDLHRYRK